MKININIDHTFDYFEERYQDKIIVVQGYVFYKKELYKKKSFSKLFYTITTSQEFEDILKNIDGIYRVIIQTPNKIWASVDSVRSLPLFYAIKNDLFIICDNANKIVQDNKVENYNHEKVKEFISLSFTSSHSTLLTDLYQIDSGQYIEYDFDSEVIERQYYYYYLSMTTKINSKEILLELAIEILFNVFKELIDSVENKTIVIPLSGGYDSRLIITMLKKLNYSNIICFTYGRNSSFEVKISKEVANKLGIKWYFIEYTEEIIKETVESKQFKEYCYYCANFSSVPHFQDYIAVKYLHDNHLIPIDSIFVPGHSGDLLGGSHLRKLYAQYQFKHSDTLSDMIDIIYSYWYKDKNFNKNKDVIYRKDIKYYFKDATINNAVTYANLTDCWDIANRQGKFIINSCRVYEFFNYQFRLPLWNRELASFWLSLPHYYKVEIDLYEEFVLNYIFKEYQIDFKSKKINISRKLLIRKVLGEAIFQFLKKRKKDTTLFSLFIKYMSKEFTSKYIFDSSHINQVTAIWYLESLKKLR